MKKEWVRILHKNCKFYKSLDGSKKEWIEKLLISFVDNFEFEEVGVDVSEEMKITIAG